MENINKVKTETDEEITYILEQTAIQYLITVSINKNTVLEYKDKTDLHNHLQHNPYYHKKYLHELDLTYINIRAETILMDKHNIIVKKNPYNKKK